MTQIASSVSIDFVTREERIWAEGGGALQITIDGCRLNKYINEDQLELEPDWKGYTGDHLFGDLYDILETTANMLSETKIYEVQHLHFDGYNDYLELEYLGEDIVRVAFRINPDREPSEDSLMLRADPLSECGYPVPVDLWARAVQHAVEEFQEELRDNGEPGQADWFDDELSKIKSKT